MRVSGGVPKAPRGGRMVPSPRGAPYTGPTHTHTRPRPASPPLATAQRHERPPPNKRPHWPVLERPLAILVRVSVSETAHGPVSWHFLLITTRLEPPHLPKVRG